MSDLALPTGSNFKRAPAMDAGVRPAYVATLATLGIQNQRPYKGQEKDPCVEVLLGFELVGETIETDDGDTLPRFLSETYKFLGGDMAKFPKVVKAIDPDGSLTNNHKELSGLLGKPCSVEVTKNEVKSAPGEFTNYIGSVTGPMKMPGYEPPAMVSEPVLFSFDEPTWSAFEKLPRWVQKKCKEANNYEGSALEALVQEHEQVIEGSDTPVAEIAHKV